MWEIGQLVKLHTSDEWNGLVGVITNIKENIISIFCIPLPYYSYYVDIKNANEILELIEEDKK